MDLISTRWNLIELKDKLKVEYHQFTKADLLHEKGEKNLCSVWWNINSIKPLLK